MDENKERIDLLLEKNAVRQLAGVDWNRLGAAISSRLDEAEPSMGLARRYASLFKIGTGIAAAAIVVIAVIVKTNGREDLQLTEGRYAVVKFIESKGLTSVEVGSATEGTKVVVEFAPMGRKVAKCDVEIIGGKDAFEDYENKAAWIIISRPEPLYADNGFSKDAIDVMYLF